MEFFRWDKNLFILGALLCLAAGVFFVQQNLNYSNANSVAISGNSVVANTIPVYIPPEKLANPPVIIKAVYVTGYSAGSKKYLAYLANLFNTTEINSVVVNIKGNDGYVSYNSGAADVKKYGLYNGAIRDIDALVRFFHNQNVYVIGRIAVFQDPVYSKARPELAIYDKTQTTDTVKVLWKDNNNLSWLDPASRPGWDYNISLAKDAFYHGFDEVNFDYIRFPSDGDIKNMGFPVYDGVTPKATVIKQFFDYTRQQLLGNKISADIFGQVTTNKDDMGIGQLLENSLEDFDYVCPMVYPSHYIANFMGFVNPAEHPYDIVKYAMSTAMARENIFVSQKPLAKFRPWLQDFNMGANYTADMVKAEIQATQDGLGDTYNGFMLWNPSNLYTLQAVLKSN